MILRTLIQLFGMLLFFFGWFGVGFLVVPLLVAMWRAWRLLSKGRTWFAWVGGLTAIFALWFAVVVWLFLSMIAEGSGGVATGRFGLWILTSMPALLIELLVFTGLFVGLRTIHRRRSILRPSLDRDTP